MELRRLAPHEAQLHREIRLRALQESPRSFGETFEEAAARPMTYWTDLTRSVTEAGRHVMLLACEGHSALGCAYGLVDGDNGERGRVGGMWFDPGCRRRGIGTSLLQGVIGWARERRLTHLGLWAPAHSPAAIALYRHAGFRETGRRRPLPTAAALQITEMEMSLRDPAP